jgi:hypothetical protein
LGKHFTVLGSGFWDRDIIGHTWAIIVLMGLAGAAAFDLIFLLPLNILILTIPDRGISATYGFVQMLPLYGLMSFFGFWWGLQFGFDAYYPKGKVREEGATLPLVRQPEPLVVQVSARRRRR